VDFRLRDEVGDFLTNKLELRDKFDELSLPGASLAVVGPADHHWSKYSMEMIKLLVGLHKIKQIVFIDHENCGAYKYVHGDEHQKDPHQDTELHNKTMQEASDQIRQVLPDIRIFLLLMGLDGKITNLTQKRNIVVTEGPL
jgi:hypothetical protein